MIASTSRGDGITIVPSPHCDVIDGPIGTTLGNPSSRSSFSIQDDRFFDVDMLMGFPSNMVTFEVQIRMTPGSSSGGMMYPK
jgi:hypothetical protein